MTFRILSGDCRELMAAMPEASVDAIVTDPPYGLEFMGKAWDSLGGGRTSAPGIGERSTEWVNSRGWNDRRCATCGHLPHGGSPCQCADPKIVHDLSRWRMMQDWHETWAHEALRVLKPGGHLLAFGGTRTYHRLVVALEDAGFKIRDTLAWMYGTGFPKSLDMSKAIDKGARGFPQGTNRADPDNPNAGKYKTQRTEGKRSETDKGQHFGAGPGQFMAEAGVDDVRELTDPDAIRWQGWGTALKPAFEPVVVARKPLIGTVAANVLAHGTGALNIDACRIAIEDDDYARNASGDRGHEGTRDPEERGATDLRPGGGSASTIGRWPANVMLDPEAAALLDEQTGVLRSGEPGTMRLGENTSAAYGAESREPGTPMTGYGDAGGASRFFYVAKASRAERNAGLDGFAEKPLLWSSGEQNPGSFQAEGTNRAARNHHPTVKPVKLMRWLVRLVTPPGGHVLDPFAGSGTTGIAAVLEGFEFTGLERDPDYVAIAEARISFWARHGDDSTKVARRRATTAPDADAEPQLGLLDGAA